MEFNVFIVIVIGFGIKGLNGQYKQPIIVIPYYEKILKPGDNLTVLCQGSDPLKWITPVVWAQYRDWTQVFYEPAKPENEEFKYASRLYIRNMSFPYFGYYKCRTQFPYPKVKYPEMYLYVDDTQNLIPEPTVIPMFINIYQDLIIPCRPTSPYIRVELFLGDEYIPQSVADENGIIYSFDPRSGFWTNVTQEISTGIYYYHCYFYYGDKMSHMKIGLTVTDRLPKPVIEGSNIGYTLVGKELQMKCKAKGYSVDFKWYIPQSEDDSRVTKDEYISEGEEYISKFVLRNVTLKDAGIYMCKINYRTYENRANIKVRIYDENDCVSINLTEKYGANNLSASTGTYMVKWTMSIEGYPVPNFNWKDNRNFPFVPEHSEKYDIKYSASDITFGMKDIKTSDRGCYTLKATNPCDSKMLKLCLNVTKQKIPVAAIKVEDYILVNTSSNISCEVTADPGVNVYWSFKPCQDNTCNSQPIKEIHSERIDTTVTSYVTVRSNHSGIISCYANNSLGEAEVHKGFFLTDVPNGFNIHVSEGEATYDEGVMIIVKGEAVTIACGVASSNYTSDVTWFHNSQLLQENDDKYQITDKESELSYKKFIKIVNATSQYDGNYRCEVRNINNKPEFRDLRLLVKEPTFPKIFNSNMGENYEIEFPRQWKFYCEVSGVPKPSVTWLKNDIPFDPKEGRVISEDNGTIMFSTTDLSDEGEYSCLVENKMGHVELSSRLFIKNKPMSLTYLYIVCITLLMILLLSIFYICIEVRKEKKFMLQFRLAGLGNFEEGAVENINPELSVIDQAELLPYDTKFEFSIKNLKLGKQLGLGEFGLVMKATAKGIVHNEEYSTVAVKMVKKSSDCNSIKALASELKIMVHIGKHINIVNLLGACTKNISRGELFVIVEYCEFGNMQNYLIKHRDYFVHIIDPETGKISPTSTKRIYSATNNPSYESPGIGYKLTNSGNCMISMNENRTESESKSNLEDTEKNARIFCTRDLLVWTFQVARGMEYLVSRKVLHGDLAARNILLAVDNIVKICDFGLARSLYGNINYEKKGDGPLPIKWMAIESIKDRVFSTQSDVWSFGIVLWEFFSLARTPYPGIQIDEEFYKKLEQGYRMDAPEYATKEIYQMMLDCWASDPMRRPSFTILSEMISNMLADTMKEFYVNMNVNTGRQENDYLAMMNPPNFKNIVSALSKAPVSTGIQNSQPEILTLTNLTE